MLSIHIDATRKQFPITTLNNLNHHHTSPLPDTEYAPHTLPRAHYRTPLPDFPPQTPLPSHHHTHLHSRTFGPLL